MAELEGWNLKTPALASRRGSRGIPTPFYMVGVLLIGGVPLLTYGRMNWFVAVGLGVGAAASILLAVYRFSKAMADRDWFEILNDRLLLRLDLIKLAAWERFFKW